MPKPEIIFIFAPDRVGKTTLARNLSTVPLQFNAPAINQKNWHEDYDRAFKTAGMYGRCVCARGPLEANLYRFVQTTKIRDYLYKPNFDIQYILINHHWDSTLVSRHVTELIEVNEIREDWRIRAELMKRMQEHYDYYKHMHLMAEELGINFIYH